MAMRTLKKENGHFLDLCSIQLSLSPPLAMGIKHQRLSGERLVRGPYGGRVLIKDFSFLAGDNCVLHTRHSFVLFVSGTHRRNFVKNLSFPLLESVLCHVQFEKEGWY